VAFLAFFGLVATTVLTFASTVEHQRGSTERTAAMNAAADGAGQFALADARGTCLPGDASSGTMQFPSTIRADTLTYDNADSGGCHSSSSGGTVAGSSCGVCLLNSSLPATTVLTANQPLTVSGDIDANGSISTPGSGHVTATHIGLYPSSATCSSCTPSNPTTQSVPFNDPLAGTLPIPIINGSEQTCNACSVISPGVYSSISVSSSPVWMKSGVYTLTGPLNISANGQNANLVNSDASASGQTDSGSGGAIDSDSGGTTDNDSGGTASNSGNKNGISYTATTVTDTSQAWAVNQWANAVVMSGNDYGIVTGNTATKLTLNAAWTPATPANKSAFVVSSKIGYTQTVLVDTSKTWAVNQWQNAVVTVTHSGSIESGIVSSNTAHTITMTANWGTLPLAGDAYTVSSKIDYTANTLVDTSKNWATNQWAGSVVTVTHAGTPETDTVQSNTATTLTMSFNWATLPSAGDAYVVSTIGYTANTLVDTSKNWANNQWAAATVTVTHSGSPETRTVTSNNSNTLTMSSNWAPTPSAGDAYAINGTGITYGANTLTDTSKSWFPHQWQGAIVTVTLSDSSTETNTVSDNTATKLTMNNNWTSPPTSGTTPSAGNQYKVVAPVVIYLACNTSAPYWSCPLAGQSGGNINTSGQGTFDISAFTTGSYAGVSVFADPNLLDPASASAVSVSGDGGSFGGTLYVPRGSVDIEGGGSSGRGVTVTGRLVVRALVVSVNSSAHGLFVTGIVPSGGFVTCTYSTDSLTGTKASIGSDPSATQQAHVQFETGCGSAGVNSQNDPTATSIINFSYGAGP
jgi:trimeric autotransporter adhesin